MTNRVQPLVSIVTVVYNGEKYLEKTIQSVLNQTYKDIEYIIIDGGSTDGTLDIIKKYEERIDYWVSERDKGIYDAMNKGSQVANGDFIIFMNSDDTFFDDATLEAMVQKIDAQERVYFGRALIQSDTSSWHYPADIYTNSNIEKWLQKALPNHQAMLFPKSFYKSYSYDLSFKIGSDSDYKFMAERECGFVFIDMVVCKFELGGVSSDFSNFKNMKQILKDSWKISMKHKGLLYALNRFIRGMAKYMRSKIVKKRYEV